MSVEKFAKEEGAIFLKIDPAEKLQTTNYKLQTTKSIQPRETTVLDLAKSEDELLSAMHEKTRYNIRLAERRGVRITKQESRIKNGELGAFWNLLQETAGRDKFKTHPREHYEKLLAVRDEEFSNEIFFAEYNGKIIAAVLVNFYKPSDTATYLHGASGREYREVMAPHLLHWHVIKEAKARGFKHYDFWGIDEKRWPGLTRFKLGFGGAQIEYLKSFDLIYRPTIYKLYQFLRNLRI
ncbi:MAG: peptidoglycan bridge formation glycyltransferase FemA/FemB family protein [Candidatus Sungbacteria bacterium]|nr:peptidoglycan bridge formation glycyltransferase FemA/FemB family protein [Candidatus Sungbacteria bacterium]